MSREQSLLQELNKLGDSATIIIGIGNILKGDDGAGPLVCQQLKDKKISVDIIDAGTVPENYIRKIIKKTPQNLVVVDAIDFGAKPGTIKIFEPEQLSSHAISTHSLSPRLFVEMISQNVSVDVFFIGIQPEQMQLGQPVSPKVNIAIQELCKVLAGVFTVKD